MFVIRLGNKLEIVEAGLVELGTKSRGQPNLLVKRGPHHELVDYVSGPHGEYSSVCFYSPLTDKFFQYVQHFFIISCLCLVQ